MQSQATLPSQSDVWGVLPLRFESGLAAQKLEIWRLWGLSEEFGSVGDNSTVNLRKMKSLMSSRVSWCARSLSRGARIAISGRRASVVPARL